MPSNAAPTKPQRTRRRPTLTPIRAVFATLLIAALIVVSPATSNAPVAAGSMQNAALLVTDGAAVEQQSVTFIAATTPAQVAATPATALPASGLLRGNGGALALMALSSGLLMTAGIALLVLSRPDYA